jgi:hypothetical protein
MIAKCLGVRYEEGDFYLSQGVKKGTRTTYRDGYVRSPRGCGWGNNFKGSKLILFLEVEGKRESAWIDNFFKDNIGRLTEKRRDIIEQTIPATIEVKEYEKNDGSTYYIVDDADMVRWLRRTGL